jgi:hypothetical protein
LFQGVVAQQLGLVADQDRVLFFALVQAHDGFRDLAHQIDAVVGRFQVQFERQLTEQVQG